MAALVKYQCVTTETIGADRSSLARRHARTIIESGQLAFRYATASV
jgi:hypothetical protein